MNTTNDDVIAMQINEFLQTLKQAIDFMERVPQAGATQSQIDRLTNIYKSFVAHD